MISQKGNIFILQGQKVGPENSSATLSYCTRARVCVCVYVSMWVWWWDDDLFSTAWKYSIHVCTQRRIIDPGEQYIYIYIYRLRRARSTACDSCDYWSLGEVEPKTKRYGPEETYLLTSS